MAERTIQDDEIGKIPVKCMLGEVFRETDIQERLVVCARESLALSQKGKGRCPDPENCPMAKFPSDTAVKVIKR